MNEEHKHELMAKDEEISALQLKLAAGLNSSKDMYSTMYFRWGGKSLLALDNGSELLRRIEVDQIDFSDKQIVNFKNSVLAFRNNNYHLMTVTQLTEVLDSPI